MSHTTHAKRILGASAIALLVATTGCSKPSAGGGGGPAGSAAAGGGGKGLAASGNDPKLVELAKKALACPWKADDGDFDHSCPDWKAWFDASSQFDDGKNDATLVAMLEDDDVKVRELAVFQLSGLHAKFTTDKALASRVVAVAEAEKGKYSDVKKLGFAVGDIHQKDVGTFDRVKAIVKSGSNDDIRLGILDQLVMMNQADAAVFDFAREMTKDSNKEIARGAVRGFKYADTRAADACKVFADSLALPNVADVAAMEIAEEGHNGGVTCDAQIDALLTEIEKRAKAGTIDDTSWSSSLGYVVKNSKASAAQKTHAVAIAKLIVENPKNKNYARSDALGVATDGDAKGGKAYAKRFLKDKDTYVASKAKTINDKK